MFFIKSKPVVLEFFTAHAGIYEHSKPAKANEFIPEWWKRTPKIVERPKLAPGATMRSCIGFIELYKHGFMLPAWTDVFCTIDNKQVYSWKFADDASTAVIHAPEQAGPLFFDTKIRNLKLLYPWAVRSNDDIQWHLSQPIWNSDFQSNWVAPSAVVNFKYQFELNVNLLLLKIDKPRDFTIPFGTPLLHYIPMTQRPVKYKHHLVSKQEYDKLAQKNARVSFVNSYFKKMVKIKG